jgi:membrane protein insertase Oxa1/YidC/SpoIIIJ
VRAVLLPLTILQANIVPSMQALEPEMDKIQQRRLMMFLPVAYTIFIARFPAGLFVYWVTSNAVSLIQNLFIYRCVSASLLPLSPEEPQEPSTQPSVGKFSTKGFDLAKSSADSRARWAVL